MSLAQRSARSAGCPDKVARVTPKSAATKTPIPLVCVVVVLLLVGPLAGCGSQVGRGRSATRQLSQLGDSPSWSPDGRRIVFISGPCDSTVCPEQSDLYVVNSNGTGRHRLTRTRKDWDFGAPVWSPDGRRIAFDAEPSSGVAIYVMNADGSRLRRLTPIADRDYEPSWSPDGKQIAFKYGRLQDGRIGVMNADGSNRHLLTPTSVDALAPSWSPDGRRLAFVASAGCCFEIDVMNSDGGNRHRLKADVDTNNEPVAWSPDGQRLAFDNDFDLWVMNADGRGAHALGVKDGQAPAWSPDGKRIAFVTFRDHPGIDELYVMDADGSNQRPLVTTRAGR